MRRRVLSNGLTALAANWQNLLEVRRVYPHADGVETILQQRADGVQHLWQ